MCIIHCGGVATDGLSSQNFRHCAIDQLLKMTDDGYQGEGCWFACTNCVCQLPLLLLSVFLKSEKFRKISCVVVKLI